MTPEEVLRSGRVAEALSALQAQVREAPQVAKYRVFLSQLLCITGQWEKALTQAQTATQLDPANLPLTALLGSTIKAEQLRTAVFAGKATPMLFGEPQDWMAWMVRANQLSATGQAGEADALRAKALEAAPATPGTIDGVKFEWLADADSRLGPVFEVIVNGGYYWMPMSVLASVDVQPPEQLRDVVWAQAILTFTNGGQALAQMPTRYAGSEAGEPALQLARKTEWRPIGEEAYAGLGQRMLQSDIDEHPLLQIRTIQFDVPNAVPPVGERETPKESGNTGSVAFSAAIPPAKQ